MFGKKITEEKVALMISHATNEINLELEKLKTHINSLRGLINRRAKDKLDEEEETPEEPKKENNKNNQLVPI